MFIIAATAFQSLLASAIDPPSVTRYQVTILRQQANPIGGIGPLWVYAPINDLNQVVGVELLSQNPLQYRGYVWDSSLGYRVVPDPPSYNLIDGVCVPDKSGAKVGWSNFLKIENSGHLIGNNRQLAFFVNPSGDALPLVNTLKPSLGRVARAANSAIVAYEGPTVVGSNRYGLWVRSTTTTSIWEVADQTHRVPTDILGDNTIIGHASSGALGSLPWARDLSGHDLFLDPPTGSSFGSFLGGKGANGCGFWAKAPSKSPSAILCENAEAATPFVWSASKGARILKVLPESVSTVAWDTSGSGVIVGTSAFDSDDLRAVVWQDGKEPRDLNTLIDDKTHDEWRLCSAQRVNAGGAITGQAIPREDGNPLRPYFYIAVPIRKAATRDRDGE